MEMSEILTKHFAEVEAKVGPMDSRVREALARLDELEQKTARRPVSGTPVLQTPGQRFVEEGSVKAFLANPRAGYRVGWESKAIISGLTTDADGSAGDLVVAYRDGLVDAPRRALTIRDLLPTIRITGNSVQFPKMTGFTNSAATVSETAGTTKPQSELKFDLVTVNVTTIAHWVYAMRQVLDDAPQLANYVDSVLIYGLKYAEEAQLLNGDGTGTNLNGIYTQATAMSANPMVVASPTKIDVIGAAILQQNTTNLPADGVIMNPADWTSIQLLKDSAGNYIVSDPQAALQPRLFNLPVVLTAAMTIDKFLVGSFQSSAVLYDRQEARVEISTEDGDNFRQNKVTILAEERIALAVKNTLGFTKGDFSDAITDLTS